MVEHPIERIDPPSPEVFRRKYVRQSRPVVIRGAMGDWPAMSRWTPAQLAADYGERTVSATPVRAGRAIFDPGAGITYSRLSMRDYVASLEAPSPAHYVVFKVANELPELSRDVRPPPYCRDAPWQHSRFWFAPPGVSSVLHRDLPENLYAQVYGRKRWILVDRRATRRVYSYPPWSGVPNFARADLYRPDLTAFPKVRGLSIRTAVLEPGELLYIPSRWWHQAASVDTSISINLWWAEGPLYLLVRAAEIAMSVRRLRY
jgi:lysine-specific demethylase 8